MRLEKFLVICGIATGKVIKKIIKDGEITVNGIVQCDCSTQVEPSEDIIFYLGKEIKPKTLRYYLLNKPAGYLTAVSNPINSKPIVMDLIPESINKQGLAPIGRLDKDTEGVLILTNDGNLNYLMTYPDKVIDKEYYVELDRDISFEDVKILECGIIIDDYLCKPAKVEILTNKSINLTITEGKYHQVKKMMKSIKNKVIYLKRVRMGKLTLQDLKIGEIKEITLDQII
ncbi:MAG: rRNA pseudouridine synthase [Fusobacteriaceae bacterium]|nr:rRNA pseudouridine synthase [Fusobacteriaceae bacterium]